MDVRVSCLVLQKGDKLLREDSASEDEEEEDETPDELSAILTRRSDGAAVTASHSSPYQAVTVACISRLGFPMTARHPRRLSRLSPATHHVVLSLSVCAQKERASEEVPASAPAKLSLADVVNTGKRKVRRTSVSVNE